MNKHRRKDDEDIRIGQINAGKGKAATILSGKEMRENKWDILLIQEPYEKDTSLYSEGQVYKKGKTWTVIRQGINTVRIKIQGKESIVANKVQLENNRQLILVNVYAHKNGNIERELREVARVIKNNKGEIIITGDWNARNAAWGDRTTDNRGDKLMEFAVENNLIIENINQEGPTYETENGKSNIDVTMTRNLQKIEWKIRQEDNLSDHKTIEIIIKGKRTAKKIHNRIYTGRNIEWEKMELRYKREDSIQTGEGAEIIAEKLQDKIIKCCEEAYKHTKHKDKINVGHEWFDKELMIIRKETRHKRRKYQAEKEENRRKILRKEYGEVRKKYKITIEEKRKNWFKKMCTEEGDNPWGRLYKIMKDRKSVV